MSKYIDSDRLKAEIKRLKKHSEESKKEWIGEGYNQNAFAEDCRIKSFDKLISFIDSLQQEQQTDKQVVVITESHGDANIEWDCRSIDDVKELLAAGARYVSKEQEQPEVDLEKEIKDTCREYRINDHHEQELGKHDIANIAYHFFNLGLNARKEE